MCFVAASCVLFVMLCIHIWLCSNMLSVAALALCIIAFSLLHLLLYILTMVHKKAKVSSGHSSARCCFMFCWARQLPNVILCFFFLSLSLSFSLSSKSGSCRHRRQKTPTVDFEHLMDCLQSYVNVVGVTAAFCFGVYDSLLASNAANGRELVDALVFYRNICHTCCLQHSYYIAKCSCTHVLHITKFLGGPLGLFVFVAHAPYMLM
jgi:hypothetical protein